MMANIISIRIFTLYFALILVSFSGKVFSKGGAIQLSTNKQALKVNGNTRVLIIKALADAKQVHYALTPNLPQGTYITPKSCGDMLRGETCTLKIIPGAIASAEHTTITIQGINTNQLTAEIVVLTYGSRYQQGYVFDLNDDLDHYPANQSVGGNVASLGNNHVAAVWSNHEYLNTKATSLTDGKANTLAIIKAHGKSDYAAYYCATYQIDSEGNSPCSTKTCYDDWYLPAICQMSGMDKASGCLGMPSQPNMEDNLFNLTPSIGALLGYYWTSTECARDPKMTAWIQWFWTNPNKKIQYLVFKGAMPAIRCARQIK